MTRYSYDAWGKCDVTFPDPTGKDIHNLNPFRYRGYYYDRETGLYYLQSRYYDPNTGRFVNGDEIIYINFNHFSNIYSYCENNVVVGDDPTGYYNRKNAVEYAQIYWKNPNKNYYYYPRGDCANFVSQCLYAGGIEMNEQWHSYREFNLNKHLWDIRSIISYKYWYDWDITETWRLAEKHYFYFKNKPQGTFRAGLIKLYAFDIALAAKNCGIKKGDLLYFVKPNKTVPYHATIIVKVKDSEIYYAAHTSPRKEHPLSESIGKNKVYIIKMLECAS